MVFHRGITIFGDGELYVDSQNGYSVKLSSILIKAHLFLMDSSKPKTTLSSTQLAYHCRTSGATDPDTARSNNVKLLISGNMYLFDPLVVRRNCQRRSQASTRAPLTYIAEWPFAWDLALQ